MEFIINPPNSPILVTVFGLDLRYYGIILSGSILLGIILAYTLFNKIVSKKEADFFLDYIAIIVIFGIIGARIFYILGNIEFYLQNKSEILFINHGGLSIWGAIIFGILSLFLYLKYKKKDILLHFDIISSILPLCQAVGRFGNYFNQEAFGMPCQTFLKLYVDKIHRPQEYITSEYFHPAFLYESILNLVIFIILMITVKNIKKLKQGTIFCLYLILYSVARIIVESIRIDSVSYIYNIPIASSICLIVIAISLLTLKKIYKN